MATTGNEYTEMLVKQIGREDALSSFVEFINYYASHEGLTEEQTLEFTKRAVEACRKICLEIKENQ